MRWLSWTLRGVAVLMLAVAPAPAVMSLLWAQASTHAQERSPTLGDTIAILLAVAQEGYVDLHGRPRLVPAVDCFRSSRACRQEGVWLEHVERGRVLMDSVSAILAPGDTSTTYLTRREWLELSAPVFFGAAYDSARIEVGVRRAAVNGPRTGFASDAHVLLIRDPETKRWFIMRRTVHRIT